MIDLTTLSGDDTEGRVRRLCAKARQPVRADLLDALGMGPITTGAVCVYHDMIEAAVEALEVARRHAYEMFAAIPRLRPEDIAGLIKASGRQSEGE